MGIFRNNDRKTKFSMFSTTTFFLSIFSLYLVESLDVKFMAVKVLMHPLPLVGNMISKSEVTSNDG